VTDQKNTRLPLVDLRRWAPVIAQLLGIVAVAVGFGLLAVWAGLVAGGLGLLAAGVVAEMTGES
jgi:hypothetical protein